MIVPLLAGVVKTLVISMLSERVVMRVLLMKPQVKGTAEIESAPMIVIIVVIGMDLYSPPNSVHLLLPVR